MQSVLCRNWFLEWPRTNGRCPLPRTSEVPRRGLLRRSILPVLVPFVSASDLGHRSAEGAQSRESQRPLQSSRQRILTLRFGNTHRIVPRCAPKVKPPSNRAERRAANDARYRTKTQSARPLQQKLGVVSYFALRSKISRTSIISPSSAGHFCAHLTTSSFEGASNSQ
jgi:hypothetical protein